MEIFHYSLNISFIYPSQKGRRVERLQNYESKVTYIPNLISSDHHFQDIVILRMYIETTERKDEQINRSTPKASSVHLNYNPIQRPNIQFIRNVEKRIDGPFQNLP